MEAHLKVSISAGRPCVLVSRFFYRHAHSIKLHSTHYKAPAFVVPFPHLTFHCVHNARISCLSSSIQEDILQNNAGMFKEGDRLILSKRQPNHYCCLAKNSFSCKILLHTASTNPDLTCIQGGRMIKVKFVLRKRCEFGQQFYVIGDNQRLGGWAPEAALPMQWAEGHVWTAELDLLSGTCAEFKVLLKADQDVLEWQPGPNCKLEVSERVTPVLFLVPWSDEEENLENDAPGFIETIDLQRTQNIVESTSSTKSLPDVIDNVEGVDLATDASASLDVTGEAKTGERSDNNGTSKVRAKDFVHEKQAGTKGLFTGDRGLSDEISSPKPDPSPEEFFSSYAIPESWYVERSGDVLVSHEFTEPSPGLLEVNAPGNLTSAIELYLNKEEDAADKPFPATKDNETFTDTMKSEADTEHISTAEYGEQVMAEDEQADALEGIMLSNAEPEDIQKQNVHSKEENGKLCMGEDEPADSIASRTIQKEENGKQLTGEDGLAEAIASSNEGTVISNAEPDLDIQKGNAHSKDENGKQQLTGEDGPDETIASSNLGSKLANAKPENIQEMRVQVFVSQPELTAVVAEPKVDLIDSAVLRNEKPTADAHAMLAENEESEIPRMQSDPAQAKETEHAKEKKGGSKGWSKVWNAFVRGRIG